MSSARLDQLASPGSEPKTASCPVWLLGAPRGVESPALWNDFYMDLLAAVVLGIFVFLTTVLVIGLFVWGAIKDGQEDRAVQARLGIRRRTRLGR